MLMQCCVPGHRYSCHCGGPTMLTGSISLAWLSDLCVFVCVCVCVCVCACVHEGVPLACAQASTFHTVGHAALVWY